MQSWDPSWCVWGGPEVEVEVALRGGAGAADLLASDSDGRTWDSRVSEGRRSSEGGLLSEKQEGA